MRILLDISRLISGTGRPAPTGIDRVEHAYARHFLTRDPAHVTFMLSGPVLPPVALPLGLVSALLEALQALWRGTSQSGAAWKEAQGLARQAQARRWLGLGRGALRKALHGAGPALYLLVSHRGADHPRHIRALKRRGVRFIPLVHDLIPITHPEYAPPRSTRQHLRRLETFATLADGIIVNSGATAETLNRYLAQKGVPPSAPILPAPLGIDRVSPNGGFPRPEGPYFLCLGTIEPRKNHLLLLHIWRELAQTLGDAAPKLMLVGRRGWENENILDMLERCPALTGKVMELSGLPDAAVAGLLQGARALLFPSFAEGYGLPLAEALRHGVPAICADLPALREVGAEVPEYLDPLDGLGWRRMILDYAEEHSPGRQSQLARLASWSAPTWQEHFALVDPWLESLAKAAPRPWADRAHIPAVAQRSRQGLAPQTQSRG
ncbi:MAG: glycosyltransferase family 4 protein [Roseomonas sp.]|nr:glycosyltransferase family 4 protein [Roseomonas sp.]